MARWSFTEHPASVGETYVQHFASAWGFAGGMLLGGIACAIHGLLPFVFKTTGSSTIARLHDRMIVNRARQVADTTRGLQDYRRQATANAIVSRFRN